AFGDVLIFAAICAAAVGFRPQFALAVAPLALFVAWRIPSWRARVAIVAGFAAMCALWFGPLIASFGGVGAWLEWARQDSGAATDAVLAGLRGVARNAEDLFLQPWGTWWIGIPVVALAGGGLAELVRRRSPAVVPLALVSVPWLLFAIWRVEPLEPVREAWPIAIATAAFAGYALATFLPWFRGRVGIGVALAFAVASVVFVWPLLTVRGANLSPPVQAVEWIEQNVPADAVILHDEAMAPYAKTLLDGVTTVLPVDEGLRRFARRPEVPLWILGAGPSNEQDAAVFWWPESVGGEHRIVSVTPVPPRERYEPLEGLSSLRRAADGSAFRWISEEAAILLPRTDDSRVRITMTLPNEAPWTESEVHLFVDGNPRAALPLERGADSRATLRVPEGGLLAIVPQKTWVRKNGAEVGATLDRVERLP
ncbi:MAG: hypothetical protein ACRD2J_06480, partial [Thermoanaerobaculia bacterium]